ncbi:hypothetical protein T484DRAFT_1816870, partial [Baffinella frigidus]
MITSLAFPPDGSVLVSASRDCSVRIWGVGAPAAQGIAGQRGGAASAMPGGLDGGASGGGGRGVHANLAPGGEMEMVDPWVAAEAGGEQERTADMFAPDGGEKRRGEGARVEKPVGVAAKLSGHLQVITSKAVSKLGLGVPEQLASLWKGSLFSESEIQRIRQKRDSGITPDEKAQGLYWEMYQQRPAEAAAGFAEASADLASLFHQAGSSTEEISAQLHRLIQQVDAPEEKDGADEVTGGDAGKEGTDGVGADEEEGGEASEELKELETMVAQQRKERVEFSSKLKSEQQVMKQLQEDVEAKESAGGAKGKDLKSLIKAATFAGYRMAELKFERDSKVAGDDLGALKRQRAKFESFAAERRAELKQQAQAVQDLLEQFQQKAQLAAADDAWREKSAASLGGGGEGGAGAGADAFYSWPLPHGCAALSSPAGFALLHSVGAAAEALALRALEAAEGAGTGGVGGGALGAVALALTALQVGAEREWGGARRNFSAGLLLRSLPKSAAAGGLQATLPLLVGLAEANGALARATAPPDADLASFKAVLRHAFSEAHSDAAGDAPHACDAGGE